MLNLNEMNLKEKVGQLFMCGFYGHEPSEQIIKLINDYKIGGVIYFSRNIESTEQVFNLSNKLQSYSKTPLFIGIDQEGGIVARITEGVTNAPGNMAVAAGSTVKDAEKLALIVGEELRALGINMNYAPCIDVNNNPKNPVIGVRSYGEDPKRVADYGVASVKGYQTANVVPVVKHFPGHGDTDVDSHLGLPVVKHDMDRLERVELYPFKKAIENDADAVMVSHVAFTTVEDEKTPATLSKNVITGLLRNKLKFNGVVMTDCMEMKAVKDNFPMAEAAIRALEAGNDIVLISHTYELQKEAIEGVIKAVKEGRLSEQRINESVNRVLLLKEKRQLNIRETDWDKGSTKLGKKENMRFAEEISDNSITIVKNENKLIPLKIDRKTLIIWPTFEMLTEVEESVRKDATTLKTFLNESIKDLDEIRVSIAPTDEEINQIEKVLDKYEQIAVCSYNALTNKNQTELINRILIKNENIIVVSLRNPYDLINFKNINGYVIAYDNRPLSLKSVAKILLGVKKSRGNLPITLDYRNE